MNSVYSELLLKSKNTLFLLLGFSILMVSACADEGPKGPPPKFDFELELTVVDQNDYPIAAVPVLLDKNIIGYTDKEGRFQAVLHEHPDVAIELGAGDMDGYRYTAPQSRTETLRIGRNLSGEIQGLPISHTTTIASILNDYLIWVSAKCEEPLESQDCKGLDVQYNGKHIATTDSFGRAHFTVKGVEGDQAKIAIITPKDDENNEPAILPADPQYDIQFGYGAGVFLVEEGFRSKDAAKKAAATPSRTTRSAPRKSTSRPTTRSAPKKTQSPPKTAPKAAPKKAEEPAQKKRQPRRKSNDNSVIDLW